jgi:hypothetical protein
VKFPEKQGKKLVVVILVGSMQEDSLLNQEKKDVQEKGRVGTKIQASEFEGSLQFLLVANYIWTVVQSVLYVGPKHTLNHNDT